MVEQPVECCPPFDPAPWDDKVFEWTNKRFIRDKVFTLFYMPMNFGKVMRRLDARVKSAGATIPDNLCLADHTSKWNMDVYLAVDRDIPGAQNTTLTGKFFSKVYDGPFKDTGKWCKDFAALATGRGLTITKWYMWYTTCPKCAKKSGHNFVVIVAEVK
ncbi:MAG: hypothetical protein GX455_17710 [Phycisphaerae bacterium]|nr:hypothetical protein [Phycisphaerae bacterium]